MLSFITIIITIFIIIFQFQFSSCQFYFHGNGYMSYKMYRFDFENLFVNEIRFQFRTVHSYGDIIIMMGEHNNSLMLQLIEGKLSYTLLNYDIPSTLVLGTYLNDNKWHEVHVIRNGRVTKVTVDYKTKTLLSPLSFHRLQYNANIYIGGYPWMQKDAKLHIRHNFVGCLNNLSIEKRVLKKYFLDKNPRIQIIPVNSIEFGCKSETNALFGFTKLSSSLSINLFKSEGRVQNEPCVRFSLRTYNAFSTVMSTKNVDCTVRLTLVGGKLVLEAMYHKKTISKISTESFVNDGIWHEISVCTALSKLSLGVDAIPHTIKPNAEVPQECIHINSLLFGDVDRAQNGFIGCINDITLNQQRISKIDPESNTMSESNLATSFNEYTFNSAASNDIFHQHDQGEISPNLLKIRVKHVNEGACRLSEKCYPNPCLYGGICSQTWKSYKCDCSKINYYGNNCEISIYKSTCAAYYNLGLREESYCLLATADTPGSSLVTTTCKFDPEGYSYSELRHDKMKEFDAENGDETLLKYVFHRFKYDVEQSKIEHLVKKSVSCRQQLSFRCFNSPLMNTPKGPPNVQWISRHGESKGFWGGATESRIGCGCGVNSSCIEENKLCNCDSLNQNKWLVDSGFITDKTLLPVTRLDVTGITAGAGFFTVGPLQCFGSDRNSVEGTIPSTLFGSDPNMIKPPMDILQRICVRTSDMKESFAALSLRSMKGVTEPAYVIPTKPTTTLSVLTPQKNAFKLSILEIALISGTGLALIVLIFKYCCCRLVNKLHGEVILHPVHTKSRYDHVLPNTPRHSGNVKLKVQKPINSYWV